MFKFDPKIFSSTPVWIKETILPNNCNHLGLVFGREQKFVYAFSWYNSLSTVSLIDTDGNSKWQYSSPNGDSLLSNMI